MGLSVVASWWMNQADSQKSDLSDWSNARIGNKTSLLSEREHPRCGSVLIDNCECVHADGLWEGFCVIVLSDSCW